MVIKAKEKYVKRILIGIPMTGLVRSEWMLARYGQVIPCNWSQVDMMSYIDTTSPIGFTVADARNIIATHAVENGFEWLFFIDHDTILPPYTILEFNDMMLKGDVPIFGGLYFTRSVPSEPLVYRGRGNSYFKDWEIGDKVWVDGLPMGCTMIHTSILKALYNESEEYNLEGRKVRRIFETPASVVFDPETNSWMSSVGTEDLKFCDRVINDNIFEKAGWDEYKNKEFPFLINTKVYCKHIDNNGIQYPSMGEDLKFMPQKELSIAFHKLNKLNGG